MIPRFAGASLGLLAFASSVLAGLYAGNPVTVTLSRSILALFLFCVMGFVLGKAAQAVVAEYERTRMAELDRRHRVDSAKAENGSATEGRVETSPAS